MNKDFMMRAIELAKNSVKNGGGPFGAVIVKDGKIIAEGSNNVTIDNDPTAHGEVTAIRKACKALNTFDLSGCELYTSCEPCPMCLSSMYWARINNYYYACTQDDARKVGFDDSFIYKQLELKPEDRNLKSMQMMQGEAIEAFEIWNKKENKTEY